MELRRHHLDFAKWEDMADKGAQQLTKAKAWDELYELSSKPACDAMADVLRDVADRLEGKTLDA